MQKLINVIALLSGIVSLSVLCSAFYLYKNSNHLIEDARNKITKEITNTVMESIPKVLPKAPTTTGLPIYNSK
jgi:hypothetical protein